MVWSLFFSVSLSLFLSSSAYFYMTVNVYAAHILDVLLFNGIMSVLHFLFGGSLFQLNDREYSWWADASEIQTSSEFQAQIQINIRMH